MKDPGPTEPVGADARRRLSALGLPTSLPLPRWFAVLAAVCAIGLIPWIVFLAFSLPSESRSENYAFAWVGFDVAMFAALAALAVAAIKRSTWTEPLATCSATILVIDAWFDIVTASDEARRWGAIGSAAVVELPLAFLCGWVALNTEVFRRAAFRRLARHLLNRDEVGRDALDADQLNRGDEQDAPI